MRDVEQEGQQTAAHRHAANNREPADGPACPRRENRGREHHAANRAEADDSNECSVQPKTRHQEESRRQRAGNGAERIGHIDTRRVTPNRRGPERCHRQRERKGDAERERHRQHQRCHDERLSKHNRLKTCIAGCDFRCDDKRQT